MMQMIECSLDKTKLIYRPCASIAHETGLYKEVKAQSNYVETVDGFKTQILNYWAGELWPTGRAFVCKLSDTRNLRTLVYIMGLSGVCPRAHIKH